MKALLNALERAYSIINQQAVTSILKIYGRNARTLTVHLKHKFIGEFPIVIAEMRRIHYKKSAMEKLRILILMAAGLSIAVLAAHAQPQAEARMFSLALRFEPATSGFGGSNSLVLGTSPDNGEVFSTSGPYSHASGFVLSIPGLSVGGTITFNIPAPVDQNGNGFNDFFEVSQPVGTSQTNGQYETSDGFDSGTVTATWSRAAGSRFGTCVLQMESETFGTLPQFSHQFELLEYAGMLEYETTENGATGTLNLSQTGNESATLTGEIVLAKTGDMPTEELLVQSGSLLNESAQTLTFEPAFDSLVRDGMNYSGLLSIDDGYPATSTADYFYWVLSIDDSNDADGDGIPDLSDDAVVINPPQPPELEITLTETTVIITIHGEAGREYDLETSDSAQPGSWTFQQSVPLELDSAPVEFDRPDAGMRFWRAKTL